MNLAEIDQIYREQRDGYSEPFRLRIHRSLSWLKRAEALFTENAKTQQKADLDFAFVSAWISFNAIYARDFNCREKHEVASLRSFLNTICRFDREQQIYALIWKIFSSEIRNLVGNRYLFQPFWDFHNGIISQTTFEESFQHSNKKIRRALEDSDTDSLLIEVFNRLYTLRNQIVHGGATWNSFVNREQLKTAYLLLSKLLPVFLQVMIENPDNPEWGRPFYPFVRD